MSHSTVADYFSSEQDFSQPISARSDIRLLITETFFFHIRENPFSENRKKKSVEKFEFAKAKRGKREMSNNHESSVTHRF